MTRVTAATGLVSGTAPGFNVKGGKDVDKMAEGFTRRPMRELRDPLRAKMRRTHLPVSQERLSTLRMRSTAVDELSEHDVSL